jgi:hypothetical protein
MILYSAVFGGYDTLKPAIVPSVCLTDGTVKKAEGWTLRKVPILPDLGSQKMSRHCKLFPWEYFPDTDCSIYYDGNIQLVKDPREAALQWLGPHDVATFKHPERSCVYDEATICVKICKEVDPLVVCTQMEKYLEEGFPKNFGLSACGVLVREHTELLKEFSQLWWEELQAHSKRDQLSFDYARWKLDLQCGTIPGDILKNTSLYFFRSKHRRQ